MFGNVKIVLMNQISDQLVTNYYTLDVPYSNEWVEITNPKFTNNPIEQLFLDFHYGVVKLGMENLLNVDCTEDAKNRPNIVEIGSSDEDGYLTFNFDHQRLSSSSKYQERAIDTLMIAQTEVFHSFNNGGDYDDDDSETDFVCPFRCTQKFYVKVNPRYPGMLQNVSVVFKAKEKLKKNSAVVIE